MAATRKAAEGKLDKNGQPRNPKVPTGTPLRRERRPDQALLLIYPLKNPLPAAGQEMPPLVGFAISFPFSETLGPDRVRRQRDLAAAGPRGPRR